jgi:drug/metabolite transporter (DMT)-like permease
LALPAGLDETNKAKLMLVVLSLGWGITWPMMKLALIEIPPLSMRAGSALVGSVIVCTLAKLRKGSLMIPRSGWVHIAVGGVLNIVGFSLFSAFAQLSAATSRVAILAYTMPIWSALLAWMTLGEALTARRQIALALCVAGLSVLVYPLARHGIPLGILLATGAGLSWAAGTVYMKWADVDAGPTALAAWQIVVGFLMMAACTPFFEGGFHLWPASGRALFGVLFTGAVGSGIAYVLWFEIIRVLPAMTASLGALSAPVIGVVSSMLILGDRPTLADAIGFALIFSASACVLIQPQPLKRADAI